MSDSSDPGNLSYDTAAFLEIYGDDEELKGEIIAVFTSETPGKLERMERAEQDGNWEEVARAAHSLANTAGTMRSDIMLSTCRELEAAARSGEEAKARELCGVVQTGFTDMLEKVRSL